MKASVGLQQKPLFSEEFVLLRAESYEEAYGKSGAKGVSMEHSYLNDEKEKVCWTLQGVLEVRQLLDEEITDGTEVYSRTVSEPLEIVPRSPLYE